MRILYIGPDYSGSNATSWRDAFVQLGHEVSTVDDAARVPEPATLAGKIRRKISGRPSGHIVQLLNDEVVAKLKAFRPELTFWAKAPHILPGTVEQASRFGPAVCYMNDDMFNPRNQGFTFLDNVPRFDYILTTKSFNVRELQRVGAQRVLFAPNAYDPEIHYPVTPGPEEKEFWSDVVFVGTFRPARADSLVELARLQNEFSFTIWGGGWHKMHRIDNWGRMWRWRKLARCVRAKELWNSSLGKAAQGAKVSLGLLNHDNRDLHTCRTFEIPACGGFMLAERTEEHRLYFTEDKEAVYFSSIPEMLDKIRFYVAHEGVRDAIARAGHRRCTSEPNRYVDRAQTLLDQVLRRVERPHFLGAPGLPA